MQTGALLLDGNTLNYFGKNIPINLVLAVIAEVVLVGGAEYYRIINGLVCLKLFCWCLHLKWNSCKLFLSAFLLGLQTPYFMMQVSL